MSNDKMREAFEKDNPVPKGVIFDVSRNDYTFMRLTTEPAHPQTVHHYRRDWHVWQRAWNVLKSQQPESEPVYQLYSKLTGAWDDVGQEEYDTAAHYRRRALYTGPQPSAQVPKKIPVPEPILYGPVLDNADQIGYAEGWNDCVDAMIDHSIAENPIPAAKEAWIRFQSMLADDDPAKDPSIAEKREWIEFSTRDPQHEDADMYGDVWVCHIDETGASDVEWMKWSDAPGGEECYREGCLWMSGEGSRPEPPEVQ